MNRKLSPNLSKIRTFSDEKLKVLVYMRPDCFRAPSGFTVIGEYPFIGAVAVETESWKLSELARIPHVEYVQENTRVFTFRENFVNDDVLSLAYTGDLTGKGVTMCVLDTGLSPHLDFCLPVNRIKDFKDIIGEKKYAYDDNGHGTFVTGVAAGGGITSGLKYKGLATNAEIVAVKVIGSEGEGGAFAVLDGMQWLLDNRNKLDIKVCCMSFGSSPAEINDPLRRGAEILVRNGITVVAASGNSGINGLKSPALSPEVIGVGAVNENNEVADFTSRGYVAGRQKPEVYADGVDVVSTVSGASYGRMSGTSVAAPYVAGACCLLLEKYPTATPRRIKEMILRSASPNSNGNFILRLN